MLKLWERIGEPRAGRAGAALLLRAGVPRDGVRPGLHFYIIELEIEMKSLIVRNKHFLCIDGSSWKAFGTGTDATN